MTSIKTHPLSTSLSRVVTHSIFQDLIRSHRQAGDSRRGASTWSTSRPLCRSIRAQLARKRQATTSSVATRHLLLTFKAIRVKRSQIT